MRASPHPWPPSQETGTTVSLDETDRAVHKASLRRQLLADALMHGRNEHEENRLRRSPEPQIIQQAKWLGFTLSFRDVQNMFAKRGGSKVEVMFRCRRGCLRRSTAGPGGWIAHGVHDIDDRVDHELRLLLVDLMAAVRLRDVPCIGDRACQLLLRRLLRGVGHVAEVRGTSAGSIPLAISAGTCGPYGRSADSTTNGIGFSGEAARISSKLRSGSILSRSG